MAHQEIRPLIQEAFFIHLIYSTPQPHYVARVAGSSMMPRQNLPHDNPLVRIRQKARPIHRGSAGAWYLRGAPRIPFEPF